MNNFYTYNGIERQGPFMLEQLRDQKIAPSLMIWKDALDEVKVEFEYIKANGGSYKREEITLTHLPAHSSRTVSGPNSSRGTSVRAKISSITAKDFNFCYREYGSGVAGMEDPWRCNR